MNEEIISIKEKFEGTFTADLVKIHTINISDITAVTRKKILFLKHFI